MNLMYYSNCYNFYIKEINMSKPIIGRFSNEQLRFTRNTGYKRSDFEQEPLRASFRDVVFWTSIVVAIVAICNMVR